MVSPDPEVGTSPNELSDLAISAIQERVVGADAELTYVPTQD